MYLSAYPMRPLLGHENLGGPKAYPMHPALGHGKCAQPVLTVQWCVSAPAVPTHMHSFSSSVPELSRLIEGHRVQALRLQMSVQNVQASMRNTLFGRSIHLPALWLQSILQLPKS